MHFTAHASFSLDCTFVKGKKIDHVMLKDNVAEKAVLWSRTYTIDKLARIS